MFFHSVVLALDFIRVVTLWSAHRHSSDRPFFRDWQKLPASVRSSHQRGAVHPPSSKKKPLTATLMP